MNRRCQTVPTRFEAETRFEVAPVLAPARRVPAEELDQFKNRLLQELPGLAESTKLSTVFRRAANEAAALVWLTPYPLLLLPVLLEEKVQSARRQVERQRQIRRRSLAMLEAVA